jgi:hypothetical protein
LLGAPVSEGGREASEWVAWVKAKSLWWRARRVHSSGESWPGEERRRSKGMKPKNGRFTNLEVFPSLQVGLVLREIAEEAVAAHPPPLSSPFSRWTYVKSAANPKSELETFLVHPAGKKSWPSTADLSSRAGR